MALADDLIQSERPKTSAGPYDLGWLDWVLNNLQGQMSHFQM